MRSRWRCVTLILASLCQTNCSSVIDSYRVQGYDAKPPVGQASGSYFLPKHLVHVEVKQRVLTVSAVAVQDTETQIESGFNLSPFSDDNVSITYEGGLLKKVGVTATDRTGDIIVQLAKDVSALREAKTAGPAAPDSTTYIYEFDPFDRSNATQVNAELRTRFRGCVEVELSPERWSPGCGRWSLGRPSREPVDVTIAESLPPTAPGLYYRRPVARRVHVVQNGTTKEITAKAFANHAPVLKIDVDRTAFVKRATTLEFIDGVPTTVSVVKDSEALALAKLPLDVVNAVISAPVDALVERKKLVEAQTNLTKAQKDNIDANTALTKATAAQSAASNSLTAPDTTRAAIVAAGVRTSIVTNSQRCKDAGIPADQCAQLKP